MPQRVVVGPRLRVCFSPVVIDLLVGVNDVRIEGDGRFGVGRGHGDDGIDRIGLVVGHGQCGTGDDATHRVSDENHRAGIGEFGVPSGSLGVVVEGENVSDCLVHVLRLVKEGLAVERSHILVEVDHEEIQAPGTGLDALLVVTDDIVKVPRCFGSK